MIPFDRKVFKIIKKFTKDLNEPLRFYNGRLGDFEPMSGRNTHSIPIKLDPNLIDGSVKRLIEEGYLRIDLKWDGGYTFCITDKMLLSRQFLWDNFSQKFWGGFWAGFASAIASAIVAAIISHIAGLWSLL